MGWTWVVGLLWGIVVFEQGVLVSYLHYADPLVVIELGSGVVFVSDYVLVIVFYPFLYKHLIKEIIKGNYSLLATL